MKTALPSKSRAYQQTIEKIKDIILEKGEKKIAFIILFGSFARGDFVYDSYIEDGIRYSYASDFDILIITKTGTDKGGSGNHQLINLKYSVIRKVQRECQERLHSLSLVIEPLKHVNKMLEEGHYFFTDIKKEGILLFADENCRLAQPKKLTNQEKRKIAQRHFDIWFDKGSSFLDRFNLMFSKEKYVDSAFDLHQAAENFFNCSILVLSDYKPKTHKLEDLNKLCSSQSNQFLNIFPKATKEQKECFELLDDAYIGARYNPNYKIIREQLEYLIIRVKKLKDITEKVCKEKINSFW